MIHSDAELDTMGRVDPQMTEAANRIYRGAKTWDAFPIVTVNGKPLNPRIDLRKHCDHFRWAYAKDGGLQLALAIMADHTGNDGAALDLYKDFQFFVITQLRGPWYLTSHDINKFMRARRIGKLR
jgi:hypothetical protein